MELSTLQNARHVNGSSSNGFRGANVQSGRRWTIEDAAIDVYGFGSKSNILDSSSTEDVLIQSSSDVFKAVIERAVKESGFEMDMQMDTTMDTMTGYATMASLTV